MNYSIEGLAFNDVGALLKLISDNLRAYADAVLKEYGITFSQARAIVFLLDRGGQATQKELEEYLHISRPTAIGIVSRLEKKGYVESHIESKNHGKKTIRLTEWVKNSASEMDVQRVMFEELLLGGFEEEEKEKLKEYLRRIYNNLEEKTLIDIST